MITHANRKSLEVNNYIRKADKDNNYFVDFAKNVMEQYSEKSNGDFNVIVFSDYDSSDFYSIPYQYVRGLFADRYLSMGENKNGKRWIGYIQNNELRITGAPALNISQFYGKLSGEVNVTNPENEKRVARIAWNYFGWVKPSGVKGKSEYKGSHEERYGYGHEEWLLDTGKLIDGFHYGFLEPVRKQKDAYTDKVYDVWIYSIDGETKKRFWVGEIKNVTVIKHAEANRVKNIYVENGWLDEMEEQIRDSGANEEGFSDWQGVELFNVKFIPGDIVVNDPYFELPVSHPAVQLSRYSFSHFSSDFEISSDLQSDTFRFNSTDQEDDTLDDIPMKKIHFREPKAVEIVLLHRAIRDSLAKQLTIKHGKSNVRREHPAGYGSNKIDIVLNDKGRLIFYEIKTYNSITTSVREAFGQLMEYCFYPDKNKASELIIVSQLPADEDIRKYFQHIRESFQLPIYYQSYDLSNSKLSNKH